MGVRLALEVFRLLGPKGTAVAAVGLVAFYFLAPPAVKESLLGAVFGRTEVSSGGATNSTCALSAQNQTACDFSRAILASTEDVWQAKFAQGDLPKKTAGPYQAPVLVVFSDQVATGGCGSASSQVGPFYCPADRKLYLDPSFYQVMETQLKARGDFAQAYVVAHEVGHHVQNLMGTSKLAVKGDSKNETSVRVELQADCLAGVWGKAAKSSLEINEDDLEEALLAAHAIGDDSLGHKDRESFTHGSSTQRKRWYEQGFDSGLAASCDTFGTPLGRL